MKYDPLYIAAPLMEKQMARVLKVLEQWNEENSGDKYHKMPNGKEKNEHGMMIHDIRGAISSFKNVHYKKKWSEFEPFFYPNKKK